jgi:CheY-like chemotaxis protein
MKPFISTKNSTGLGLSICRRVVEEAGGTIELGESNLGGLRVAASFPLISESADTPLAPKSKTSRGINGRILVVEDNDTIRDVLVRTIQAAGGSVTALERATKVEQVMNDDESPFNLLIFDIDLPERTGIECLSDLRASGDTTPCLLITGGTTEPPQFENIGFLRKPFRMETLLECCNDLIDIR